MAEGTKKCFCGKAFGFDSADLLRHYEEEHLNPREDQQQQGQQPQQQPVQQQPHVVRVQHHGDHTAITHLDVVKSFECDICGKRFSAKENLRNHRKSVHFKHIKCEDCGKMFSQKGFMERHRISAHLGHPCNVCGKKFTLEKSLLNHTKLFHQNEKPLECSSCDKIFSKKSRLSQHISSVHLRLQVCDLCGKRLSSRRVSIHKRAVHLKLRPYKCDICEKTFFNKQNLERHHQSIHQPKAQCQFCGKEFTLVFIQRHIDLMHLGNLSHQCAECGKRFVDKPTLERHTKDTHLKGSILGHLVARLCDYS